MVSSYGEKFLLLPFFYFLIFLIMNLSLSLLLEGV
nr:MAG TPA: hypothetical protein [Caudoviricetes sp.]